MHVCFHGGGGGGDRRVAKSISVIRGLTKSMKAMSLKVKVGGGGGGNHARARRRRRPLADDQRQDCKDVAAAAASASAKIAPAQLQEEADDDHQLQEEEEEEQGGGKKQEYCDKCCSPLFDDGDGDGGGANEAAAAMVTAEMDAEESSREWVAEPEPGVVVTLAPRPDGTNRLRRIRFREALFDAWAAQSWWADNYDRVVELYSVVQSDNDEDEAAAAAVPVTPCQSEEKELPGGMTGAEESGSPSTSNFSGGPSSGSGSGAGSAGTVGSPILGLVTALNTSGNGSTTTTTTTSRAAQHDSIGDQPTTPWREWIEEYEAGVFITVRAYPGHHLQLRRVELSRERFGEVKARVWWQENKARLHHLYSF